MFETFKNAWKSKDLRKKLLFTLLIIVLFRIGVAIPVPFLDASKLSTLMGDASLLGYMNMLTGGALSKATIFAMSVTPYINASIIIQLLTVAIPALERLAKDGGEMGRKKINKITRYTSVGLGLIQAIGFYFLLRSEGAVQYTTGWSGIFASFVICAAFTAGTALIMWLGELVNEKGIGNGISIIIFAGILSRGPHAANTLWQYWKLAQGGDIQYYFLVPAIILLFVAVIAFVVVLTNAERRIPVQYAKRVVGRKMYGGQSSHIPIKVNLSGVMPVIFASSILAIPSTIGAFMGADMNTGVWKWFSYSSWLYATIYFILIIGFNYFYAATQYNPIEMANNLRKSNGAIPLQTRYHLRFHSEGTFQDHLLGAIFLGIVAILPIAIGNVAHMNIALGGTSMLIVVGVALDTSRTLESQMMMRHYKGFLE
ncbi:MAG: preprotein translocase subunit SecY [Oscillospiraceae bacterium]